MTTLNLRIQGMHCEHCARAVTNALQGVEGVRNARVDLKSGRAAVEYDEARTGPGQLVGAVMEEGYTAEETP